MTTTPMPRASFHALSLERARAEGAHQALIDAANAWENLAEEDPATLMRVLDASYPDGPLPVVVWLRLRAAQAHPDADRP